MNIIWVGPAQFEQTSPKTENNFRLCPKNMPALSANRKNCIESVSREEKVTSIWLFLGAWMFLLRGISKGERVCTSVGLCARVYLGLYLCLYVFRSD